MAQLTVSLLWWYCSCGTERTRRRRSSTATAATALHRSSPHITIHSGSSSARTRPTVAADSAPSGIPVSDACSLWTLCWKYSNACVLLIGFLTFLLGYLRLCQTLFVCLSVCQQNNLKSYKRIFLKFSGNVGNGKNLQRFNFGGDPEGILDSGSLWNFR